jgi:3-isopropylmalate/(R)-2-methylmalate dehydratase large subunit
MTAVEGTITKRATELEFKGRTLFLTDDVALIRRQLEGKEDLAYDAELALMNNISTDEITPGWVCFITTKHSVNMFSSGCASRLLRKMKLKRRLCGCRLRAFKGLRFVEETAPYAEKWAGIELVIAQTIEKIYGQNAQNIGLHVNRLWLNRTYQSGRKNSARRIYARPRSDLEGDCRIRRVV